MSKIAYVALSGGEALDPKNTVWEQVFKAMSADPRSPFPAKGHTVVVSKPNEGILTDKYESALIGLSFTDSTPCYMKLGEVPSRGRDLLLFGSVAYRAVYDGDADVVYTLEMGVGEEVARYAMVSDVSAGLTVNYRKDTVYSIRMGNGHHLLKWVRK